MATLDEVVAEMLGDDYIHDPIQFVIDSDLRVVSIPRNGVVAGVVGDKNVNRVNFQMPRYYNGFDMSKFTTRVNYINALGNFNYYSVTDLTIEDDLIYFTWLVDSDVVAYAGIVMFAVNMFITDSNGKITQSFNTSNKGLLNVLEGIQVNEYVTPEEQEDILTRLEADISKYVDSGITKIDENTNKSIQKIQTEKNRITESITSGINSISSLTTESIDEIQNEGVNVKNSIPADYTKLNKTVSDITDQIPGWNEAKEKVTSLKEHIGDLDNSIDGDSFLKTLATISTELFYNSYYWFIPLNLYSQGDTILIYFPTIVNGTYSTYFCDESKSALQAVEVTIVNHLASVVYPKFGKTYSFLRMPGEKETDLCYLKKKNATIFGSIDSLTQKNVMTLFADNTGNTDVSHDVQMLINSMESDGEVEIYFPKGKYLFSNQIKHKKGNVTFRCAKGAEIIVNSSPIYTPFEIAGANVLPYSLGSFKIIGGYWTTQRTFGETGNPISTGFQVTKMERVELIDAIFDELTQSNHLFDVSGSKNVFIKGCTFRGMYFNPSQKPIGRDGNFEMIQIDLASGINLSICTENGHNECTKNVVIKDCVFEPSGKDNCYLYRPIGIHFGGTLINNVVDWYDNIKIENNIFHNVLGRAIEVSCARNVSVKGNIFKQETEIIDGIIKCGSVRWDNTATWATFNGISDKQRYNCMNISILDNMLSCSVDSDEMFIDAFPILDTSSMYVNSSGSPLTKMAKNVTIKGNTGDLNIRANNIHMLNIDNNDVPNVYVDNNS